MPGFDRTGPSGAGPRTGRGMGMCGAYARSGVNGAPGDLLGVGRGGAPWGGGRGRCFGGRGMGLGRRSWAGAVPLSPTQEAEALKAQLAVAEDQITALKARLEELTTAG